MLSSRTIMDLPAEQFTNVIINWIWLLEGGWDFEFPAKPRTRFLSLSICRPFSGRARCLLVWPTVLDPFHSRAEWTLGRFLSCTEQWPWKYYIREDGDGWLSWGRWVAKWGRWVAMWGRWVAKFREMGGYVREMCGWVERDGWLCERDGWLIWGRWVAKWGRWVAKWGRWVAKWVRSGNLSKIKKNGRHKQGEGLKETPQKSITWC